MSGTQVNLYGIGDVDLQAMMDTLDRQRITFHALSLTNYDNTSLPAIAAGSHEEVAGTLFKFTVEEAITGWAGVAVGVVYIKLVPAGTSPDTVTAVFTDTAPTWSDAKQGWYGTGAAANHKYVATLIKIDATTYKAKDLFKVRYGERLMRSRMRVTKNDAQGITSGVITIVEYDDEDFDNLAEYDNVTNHRFTAKEAGYYSVLAGLLSASYIWATEYWEIRLYKNGAFITAGVRSISGTMEEKRHSILSDLIYLAATDYIDIRVYHNRSAGVNTDTNAAYNYFAVHRLS